ncbi:unnamed protein product [Tilletia controversa]|nr:unnamed protein product [Tilletia controversa]
MSSEGATSSQGWSLSAAEICEAASMSLSLRYATDDEAEVRAQFINQIRARSAASSKYLSVSDAIAPISPSQVPPSRRIRSSSPTSDAPDLKRPKLAAPGKTLAQGHADSASESAASLFFCIPELLSLVFAQLAYEKIDLVVLSRVSKFLRANVLPLLVESLNVPLTKAAQVRDFLEANPGLAGQVKYVRIFDDIAHHLFHRRPIVGYGLSVQRSHDAPLMPKDMWEHLGNLFTTLQNNVEMLPTLMDLSFGQFNFANFLIQLRRHPRLVEELASLRIVDDFDPEHHQGEAPDDFEYHVGFRFRVFSEDLADVVRLVCDVQDEVGSDTFRYFGIRAADSFDRPAFLPEFGPRLLSRLAKRIRHLSLVMDSVSKDDTDTYVNMADADWPELLEFEVGARTLGGDWHRTLRSATVAFCSGHKNLTVTDTCIELPGTSSSAPYWVHLTLPRLKSCSLAYQDFADRKSAVEFLSRNANIQHLSMLPEPLYGDDVDKSGRAFGPPPNRGPWNVD